MSEHKTPEQVSDDFKMGPTSIDKNTINKVANKEKKDAAVGENYQLPSEQKVKEELREGVE
jgi:hypothetical protein